MQPHWACGSSICHWDQSSLDLLAVDFILRKQKKQVLLYISDLLCSLQVTFLYITYFEPDIDTVGIGRRVLIPIACPQALPAHE